MDARDNLQCSCWHSFREHLHRFVTKGSIGGLCLMAGCPCSEFRPAPTETDKPESIQTTEKQGVLHII
jgi:hypothetical protein